MIRWVVREFPPDHPYRPSYTLVLFSKHILISNIKQFNLLELTTPYDLLGATGTPRIILCILVGWPLEQSQGSLGNPSGATTEVKSFMP